MTIKYTLVLTVITVASLPLILPARQAAVVDSAEIAVQTSPEATAVLQLVKDLEDR